MRLFRKINIIPLAAAAALSATLLSGCSPKTAGEETAPAETTAAPSAAGENKPKASESGELSGSEKDNPQIDEAQSALMLPVAEGLIRTYEEQGLAYDDQDSAYIWWTLYHTAEAMSADHSQEEITAGEDELKEYLTAAFSELTELPAIPEGLSGLVSYDSGDGSYHFRHQEESAGELRISSAEAIFGSLYEFTVHFSYPDGSTSDYTLDAVDHPAGKDGNSASFPFAFISMQPTEYPCTDNC